MMKILAYLESLLRQFYAFGSYPISGLKLHLPTIPIFAISVEQILTFFSQSWQGNCKTDNNNK